MLRESRRAAPDGIPAFEDGVSHAPSGRARCRATTAEVSTRWRSRPASRLLTSGAVAAAAFGFFSLVAGPTTIAGDSMAPTLSDGSLVVVDRVTHRLDSWPTSAQPLGRAIARGDVVLVRSPVDASVTLAKRVVAIAGDRVSYDAFGRISVNDVACGPGYVPFDSDQGSTKVTVDAGTYFIVGDNHVSSTDSREFGCVRKDAILGRIRYTLWPPGAMGAVR